MTYLDEILKSVATPAILRGSVPDAVIKKALQAGHWAPSVGLTDATKYYLIKSAEIKRQLKICLQTMMKKQLHQQIMNNKTSLQSP
jgi:nicotinate-nucleotide--dimethylbenzimidazole phosphoribosyltransferase